MENKFFTLIRPYLEYIDSGKLYRQPFRILYRMIAILMLVIPFAVLFQLIETNFFKYGSGSMVIGMIYIWLVIAAAGWFSFQLWWNRAAQLKQTSAEGDGFAATQGLATLIQTVGEWFGSYLAVVGFLLTLLAMIFLDGNMRFIPGMGKGFGWPGLVLFPVYGFMALIVCRWIAETMRALAAIANNTRK